MTNTADLLIEIGCEELPSSQLHSICNALKTNLEASLTANNLKYLEVSTTFTPRRLVATVKQLSTLTAPKQETKFGPPVGASYGKDGLPTLACMGFAKSNNTTIDKLIKVQTDKGERVACVIEQPAKASADILPGIIQQAVNSISIPKPMRWANHEFDFVRPVHWLLVLFGDRMIKMTLLGKESSNVTYGHRFLHPGAIPISHVDQYAKKLFDQGKVIVDHERRKQHIKNDLQHVATQGHTVINEDLLDEVAMLVEWPVILKGTFNPEFLKVPNEALISSMHGHQKVFPVANANGNLLAEFVLVSNIESKFPAAVVKGNERVINARLSDAAFFFNNDKKTPLIDRLEKLQTVIFEKSLGSIYDKVQRVSKLAQWLAKQVSVEPKDAKQAAELSKCDLVTEMVFEFPELQGIMGYHYARHDKVEKPIAAAIIEHYQPRSANDELPKSKLGAVLAISDRLDTLVGILGIDQKPSGTKDPFALRRAALGVIKILMDQKWDVDLKTLITQTTKGFKDQLKDKAVVENTYEFIVDRLKGVFTEQDVPAAVFAAVACKEPGTLADFDARINALQHFLTLPEAESLSAANKRVQNILKKASLPKTTLKIDNKLLNEEAEKALVKAIKTIKPDFEQLVKAHHYQKALQALTALKEPVDNFFEHVMVNTDDKKLQHNRWAILSELQQLFSDIADIALLQQ